MKWLDDNHGEKWCIWEFRAEGTGYTDDEVYNRIRHYPWPDHHPPPFALLPSIMAGMRDWLNGPESEPGRVVVVHCKAGKGRSGTIAVSYLISEELWSMEDAIQRFTARRMRHGFGPGISIPSQVRWLGYVDWWTKHRKIYVERQVEIVEVHVWGLRDGVKVAIEGYVDEGKVIKTFHTFSRHERLLMDGSNSEAHSPIGPAMETPIKNEKGLFLSSPDSETSSPQTPSGQSTPPLKAKNTSSTDDSGAEAVLFRPAQPVILPSSDVNVDFERRNKAKYGLTMVTSVAHVWFNAYFESQYALQKSSTALATSPSDVQPQTIDPTNPPSSGVFSIHWDAMDGLKGSSRKGTRAFDQLSVVWRAATPSPKTAPQPEKIITVPPIGHATKETGPAAETDHSYLVSPESVKPSKNLGLRTQSPFGRDISRSNSPSSATPGSVEDDDSEVGIQPYIPKDNGSKEDDADDGNSQMIGVEDTKKDDEVKTLSQSKQRIPGQFV